MTTCITGFNGMRIDPINSMTHLGNGYRPYNPTLLRFVLPDSWSPFGAGGINPYAYCAADPINRADPSGHMSWQSVLGIGLGVAGLLMAAFSAGASIAASGGVMAALESASALSLVVGAAGVISDAAAIASGATESSNSRTSAVMGWVSMAAGVVGMIHGVSASGKNISQGIRRLTNVATRLSVGRKGQEWVTTVWGLDRFTPLSAPLIGYDGARLNAAFAFVEEIAPGSRRLNICGHGGETGSGILFYNPDGTTYKAGPEQIMEKLTSQGLALSDINSIRLVSCYGGDNGTAQALANFTKLPVQGYYGLAAFNFPKMFFEHVVEAINIEADEMLRLIDNGQTLKRIRTGDYYFQVNHGYNFEGRGHLNRPDWFMPQEW